MKIFAHQYQAKRKAKRERLRRSKSNSWDRVLSFAESRREAKRLAKLVPISSKQRGAAWSRFLGAGDAKQRHAWLFDFLSVVDTTAHAKVIDRDVNRTLGERPDLTCAEMANRRDSIRRILVAYSNLDSKLGYCQGMNFVVSHILDHVDDEADAFWLFVAILRRTRKIYVHGLAGFYEAANIFDEIFEQVMPEVFQHFSEQGLGSTMFLTTWFHTLFVFGDRSCAARIWDNFFLGGSKVAIRIALAYLMLLKDELMQMTICELVPFLRDPPISSSQNLLDAAFSIEIPDSLKDRFEGLDEEYALSNYFESLCWFEPRRKENKIWKKDSGVDMEVGGGFMPDAGGYQDAGGFISDDSEALFE